MARRFVRTPHGIATARMSRLFRSCWMTPNALTGKRTSGTDAIAVMNLRRRCGLVSSVGRRRRRPRRGWRPNDALAFLDGQVLGVLGEAGKELFEVLSELEVGLGVVQFGVERVELGGDRGLAFTQRRHAGAELVECDELFLVGLDQAGAAGLH